MYEGGGSVALADMYKWLVSLYSVWALGEGGKKSKAEEVDPALEAHTSKNLFFNSGRSA